MNEVTVIDLSTRWIMAVMLLRLSDIRRISIILTTTTVKTLTRTNKREAGMPVEVLAVDRIDSFKNTGHKNPC
jgi:hypothetical protein